ncbi:MAG TPA: hypothetical protein VI451_14565 [Anaerolineales bacterium]|nr:hypothetical protein [Anaerolineales bacterium]
MSTSRLVTWITFLAVFAMAARVSMDTDTWWHLRAGTWMLENRAVVQTDLFSYTRAGAAWLYPGWIVQIPMTLIYRALGPGGLNLWVAGMVTLAFAFVWRTMKGGVFLKAFIIVLGVAVSGVYWGARPYIVSFVLGAVFLWIFEDFRAGRKDRLWWLPILMAIWANAHGGFAIGFILWGIYGLEVGVMWLPGRLRVARLSEMSEESDKPDEATAGSARDLQNTQDALRKMILIGLFLALAVCLNPAGSRMLLYPFQTVAIESLQDYIAEWQSPDFHKLVVQPFIWMLLFVFGAVGVSRTRLRLVDFLLVAVFAYLGLLAGRNVALFGLFAPVVLARHTGAVVDQARNALGIRAFPRMDRVRSPAQGWVNRILLGVVMLAVVAKVSLVYPLAINKEAYGRYLPLAAVEFLKETHPPGRIFNSYNWGGYLQWELPEYPVFVDGRTDLYDDEIIRQWFQVVRAEEGWQVVLDEWDVRLIFLEKESAVLAYLEDEGWELLYSDDKAEIYGR